MRIRNRSARIVLLCILLPLLALECIPALSNLPLQDFVEYWAASKLFLSGGDPYSPAAILAVERLAGWQGARPLMMLNPPWAIPLFAWTGLLRFRVAHVVWFSLSVVLLFASADYLWRYNGGERRYRWVSIVVAGTFVPGLVCLKLGQLGPLILAGITLFLWLLRSKRDFLAGLSLLALGVKPHFVYLVALAVILWIIHEKRWRVAVGAVFAYVITTTIAVTMNSQVLGYFPAAGQEAELWMSSGGAILRLAFGARHIWLQFVPTFLGASWMLFWWKRRRNEWEWPEQMPVLVLVSFITASYGWYFDEVIGLIALIPVAVSVTERLNKSAAVLALYIGTNLLIAVLNLSGIIEPWFFWTGFVWLAIYIWARPDRAPREAITYPARQHVG